MSDAEDTNGTPDDTAAARKANTWEARLKEARKQRAKVLAEAGNANSVETAEPPPPDIDEFEHPAPEPHLSAQRVKPGRKPGIVGLIAAALAFGAFLIWENPKDQINESELRGDQEALSEAAPENDGHTSLPESPALSVAELRQSQAEETVSIATDVEPSQVSSEELAETVQDIGSLIDSDAAAEPAQMVNTEMPELSRVPPLVFSPILTPSEAPASTSQTPLPSPEEIVGLNGNVPHFQDAVPQAAASFTPVPQEIENSATPQRPQPEAPPISIPVAEIDVSLFVPAQVSEETSNRTLKALSEGQATVIATARVLYTVRNTQVRYYHPQDADEAEIIAEALDGIARDFTNSGRKTRPGHVEIYLVGDGDVQQASSDTTPNSFDEFIARLINELRR